MALETWFIFVLVSILPVMSPGPAILLAISNTLQHGPRATVFSAIGNSIGLMVLGIAIAFGLGSIMATSAAVFTTVKIVGAIYLVYLGIKVWRDPSAFSNTLGTITAPKGSIRLCLEAFLVSVTNPKPILILAVLFPQFLSSSLPLMPQVLIMSATFAGLCFLNHLLLAVFAKRLQVFIQGDRRAKITRRVLGGFFIGFGGMLAVTSR